MLDSLLNHIANDATLPQLPLAFVLGALVGAEREWRRHAAGLRTCVLVAVASAAVADLMVQQVTPGNLGAGYGAVMTGIGFLCAGVIVKDGDKVKGLSTAATIWCVAAIGLQCGAGEDIGALWLTALVLAINTVLRPLARLIRHKRPAKPATEEDEALDA